MSEIAVPQGSPEWYELRRCVALTASKFGDAIGVGSGKPYDYLASLLCNDDNSDDDDNNNTERKQNIRHGNYLEPIINEAYQLLTGNQTRPSGLWLPDDKNPLHGLIAASPDAKIYTNEASKKVSGLAEYKAPVYKMYSAKQHPPHGIPRRYMAQVQGQMAVSGVPWCDFMAVCAATKQIMLKRVHFQPEYWKPVSVQIRRFCDINKEAHRRLLQGLDPLNFPAARSLQQQPPRTTLYPGEAGIKVDNLLETDESGRFRAGRGVWMGYDFLMGVG